MGYEDVRAMLSHARLGESIAVWRGEALAESRLLSGSRRVTQIRIATEILCPLHLALEWPVGGSPKAC